MNGVPVPDLPDPADPGDRLADDDQLLATFAADDLLAPGDVLDLPTGPMRVVSTQERVGDTGIEQTVLAGPVQALDRPPALPGRPAGGR